MIKNKKINLVPYAVDVYTMNVYTVNTYDVHVYAVGFYTYERLYCSLARKLAVFIYYDSRHVETCKKFDIIKCCYQFIWLSPFILVYHR